MPARSDGAAGRGRATTTRSGAGRSPAGGSKAGGSKAGGSKASGSNPGRSKAAGSTLDRVNTGGSTAGRSTPGAFKGGGSKAVGSKAGGAKGAGSKAAGSKAAGSKAAGSKAAGSKAAGSKGGGSKRARSTQVRSTPRVSGAGRSESSRATGRPKRSASTPPSAERGASRSGGPTRTSATTPPAPPPGPAGAAPPGRFTAPASDPAGGAGVRLQKVLAAAGLGSRRACEELIAAGRVEVDGVRVREQGLRVNPSSAEVRVDGVRIPTAPGHVVIALNKPSGVLSTMHDDRGRRCVGDLVADRKERLFHVGRLDADTEGLLLLTNDGDLAHHLSHPSHGVPKTYLARVAGPIPRGLGARLRDGVVLEDGPVAVDRFRVVSAAGDEVLLEVVLHEGRKHVVRRLLAEVGHPVRGLVRTRVGPIALGELRPGQQRVLSSTEVGALFTAAE